MTTLGDIKRVIAQLTPEQRAKLEAVLDQRDIPANEGRSVAAPPEQPTVIAPEPRRIARPARDLIGTWRPLPARPRQSDPLGDYRL